MGRFLTLMMLMILGALAVRTQQPSPYQTQGMANGVAWRESSDREKVMYVDGAVTGYIGAVYEIMASIEPGHCLQNFKTAIPAWISSNKHATNGEILREMDAFYQDGANISLPMGDAVEYSYMKITGATKQHLADYLNTSRRTLAGFR